MKEIFEQGEFSEYRINNLQKSRGVINESFAFFEEKVPVFISHKHDDLDDLKGIIGFLEKILMLLHILIVEIYLCLK